MISQSVIISLHHSIAFHNKDKKLDANCVSSKRLMLDINLIVSKLL